MVFCGVYPIDADQYADLKEALEKLRLNDAAISWEPETSTALGFGFRCGFLGLLHMDVVQERLEREYDLNLITTAPSVIYKITQTDGTELQIDNPAKLPDQTQILKIEEPFIKTHHPHARRIRGRGHGTSATTGAACRSSSTTSPETA